MDHARRVLLTGGAGFIGSAIVRQLVAEQPPGLEEIVVLDDFSRGRPENLGEAVHSPLVTVVRGDVRDRGVLYELFRDIDVVFHLAAIRITQCAEDPRLAVDVLSNGTLNVAEAAVARRVGKLVASSSASVYGMADVFPTPESHHGYHNRTLYGSAKAFNEGVLRSFHDTYGLDYVALRYFNVYGPGMDRIGKYTEVFIRWMEAIAAGRPPTIFGDGSTSMDLVYVGDVARANVLASRSDRTDEVFNVGTGRETTLGQLAELLCDVMGADLSPAYGPARKVNGVERRVADTSAAAAGLGFTAEVDLEEGLRRLVRWYRASVGEVAAVRTAA